MALDAAAAAVEAAETVLLAHHDTVSVKPTLAMASERYVVADREV